MYDPNWFYSSLAQCAAALVGLIGAVLATRLQHQYGDIRENFQALRSRYADIAREAKQRAEEVARYSSFADARIAEMKSVQVQGGSELEVASELEFWGGNRSGSPWSITVTEHTINSYEQRKAMVEPATRILQKVVAVGPDLALVTENLIELESLLPEDLQPAVRQLRDRVRSLSLESGLHERRTIAAVRVPAALTLILAWLCVFGLIAPMWFLSAYTWVSKGVLLVGFALGVVALPVYLGSEVNRIYRIRRVPKV